MPTVPPKQLAFPISRLTPTPSSVRLTCAICGNPFFVPPSHFVRPDGTYARYCSRPCSHIGQGQNRPSWTKGKTKADDPRIAKVALGVSAFYANNPKHNRGKNHHMLGKHHSEGAKEKMRIAREHQEITPAMLAALDAGRGWDKGRTKETDERIARRGRSLSKSTTGVPDPAHSVRMRHYYQVNPEKHPLRILSCKGHETGIERAMRLALVERGYVFEVQYHIGRFFADFAFPSQRLIVEVDGAYWHDAERDARRDSQLNALGWRVLRFSEKRIKAELTTCVTEIETALALIVEAPNHE